jgi:RNA polymerase sigma factor (sigma-70 family)
VCKPNDESSGDAAIPSVSARDRVLGPLYASCWAELCSYLERTFGVGPPDPQDVAQQEFLRYASLNTEVDAITNVRAYLYRSAYNIVVDEYRRLAVMRNAAASLAAAGLSDELTPERVLIAEERLDLLCRAIQHLPEARQRSFLLNRFDELSCAEIARRTGYSASAVKKHVASAMADLETAMRCAETGSDSLRHEIFSPAPVSIGRAVPSSRSRARRTTGRRGSGWIGVGRQDNTTIVNTLEVGSNGRSESADSIA